MLAARVCECERPFGQDECMKCGKPMPGTLQTVPSPRPARAVPLRRLPRGPSRRTRAQTLANQRDRMVLAMEQLLLEGYGAHELPVATVIERAKCSRRAFYEVFGTAKAFREMFAPDAPARARAA
jgi:hypothetical protein